MGESNLFNTVLPTRVPKHAKHEERKELLRDKKSSAKFQQSILRAAHSSALEATADYGDEIILFQGMFGEGSASSLSLTSDSGTSFISDELAEKLRHLSLDPPSSIVVKAQKKAEVERNTVRRPFRQHQVPLWAMLKLPEVSKSPKADSGGFVFVQGVYSDDVPMAEFLRGNFPPDADLYMTPEDVQVIDHAAREALLMCTVALHKEDEELFGLFFKNHSHRYPIRMVFAYIAELLKKLIHREVIPSRDKDVVLWLVKLMVPESVLQMVRAYFCPTRQFIAFMPIFFQDGEVGWGSWFHDMKKSSGPLLHLRSAAARIRARRSTGQCLLHELVHVVSKLHWDSLVSAVTDPQTRASISARKIRMIHDVRPLSMYNVHTERDSYVLRKLACLEGKSDLKNIAAYGHQTCVLMAELKHGASASFLNADSYATYAGQLTANFLDELWTTWAGCVGSSGMQPLLETLEVKETRQEVRDIRSPKSHRRSCCKEHETRSFDELSPEGYHDLCLRFPRQFGWPSPAGSSTRDKHSTDHKHSTGHRRSTGCKRNARGQMVDNK